MRMFPVVRAVLIAGLTFAAVGSAAAQVDDTPADIPGAPVQQKMRGSPGFVCSATNALRNQQCTASCPSRETADCEDADGGGTPTCQCTKG